jgi:hypothetical protein
VTELLFLTNLSSLNLNGNPGVKGVIPESICASASALEQTTPRSGSTSSVILDPSRQVELCSCCSYYGESDDEHRTANSFMDEEGKGSGIAFSPPLLDLP